MRFQSAHQKSSIENRKYQFSLDTRTPVTSNEYIQYPQPQYTFQITQDLVESRRCPDINKSSSTAVVDSVTLFQRCYPKISDGMNSMTTFIEGGWCSSSRVKCCHTQCGAQYKHVNTCTAKPSTMTNITRELQDADITFGLLCKWYNLKNS